MKTTTQWPPTNQGFLRTKKHQGHATKKERKAQRDARRKNRKRKK